MYSRISSVGLKLILQILIGREYGNMAPLRVAMLVCYRKMKKELSDAFRRT